MANSKYDHTSAVMSGPDWTGGRILAYLFSNAPYFKIHTTLDEVRASGATQRNVTEIQNRSMGAAGECQGLPAMFTVTPKGEPYQVILAWDKNLDGNMVLLAFYDEDAEENSFGLLNNGTFVVRPDDFDPATGVGTWFTL